MPSHALQQIREAMFNVLDADLNVGLTYKGRRSVHPDAQVYPVVNIASISENIDRSSIDTLLDRNGTITIEVIAKATDDCEPILYEQQKNIEIAINGDSTLNSLLLDIYISSSRQEEREDDGTEYLFEKRILTFDFQYMTARDRPDVITN